MSARRRMSAPDDINTNVSRYSRYDAHLDPPLQNKSAHAHLPPRVFIKPKAESSSDNFKRRASIAALPTPQQRNARPSLPTSMKSAYALPRRSASLHRTANGSMNMSTTRLPRSPTTVPPVNAKPAAIPEVSGDACFSTPDTTKRNGKAEVKQSRRLSLPVNKENAPPLCPYAAPERTSKPKRTFTRKQSPLVPNDRRTSQHTPPKAFLLPKIEERTRPRSEVLLPRRSSVRSVVPRSEKRESLLGKKANLPSLPSIVVKHTPKSAAERYSDQLELNEDRMRTPLTVLLAGALQSIVTPAMKPNPRPFLLPPEAGAIPPSTSSSSILSLPSQVLKHTPLATQSYRAPHAVLPSDSPCLSKARTKTIWTMVDEMKLIRTGGLLPDGHTLAPSSQARVVPLCQRLRNGVESTHGDILRRTPVRSVSTPYHLLASADRRSRVEVSSALPPLSNLSRALARARAEKDASAVEDRKGERGGERYNWTLIDVKKPERRTTLASPVPRGYCMYIEPAAAKPSLLTRAQTLVRFKFSGSRKVVGRGDPKWL